MKDFVFSNHTRIVFGRHSEARLAEECAALGHRILIVYGGGHVVKSGLLARSESALVNGGFACFHLSGVKPNPRLSHAREGARECGAERIDGILAIGGGSVIDTAKAISMGACYDGDVWDFFCGAVAKRSLPLGVILTIPAAGSESSSDCVITNDDGLLKRASCACDFLRPRFAVMNPELTYSLPAYQTACGACDIMAHVMERYFTTQHNVDVTDRLCEALLRSVISAAPRVLAAPENYDARAEMMWAGTLAHNSLVGMGRVNDWASHGMGHEISALYDIAHGATLAMIFPAWMKYVYQTDVLRFAQFANRVFDVPYMPGEEKAMALEGIRRFEAFIMSLGLPTRLSQVAIRKEDLPIMAKKCALGRTIGGFQKLSANDVETIYHLAYDR